ncbi:MAG: DNA repair protein RecO [Lachnospiraceae bacterium]|nr:DNA repair protein RecO [Candidatus Merdinaster equi]
MQDIINVTGIILKAIPVGEYDRHVCILTKERGKITAYVRGARRTNSKLLGSTGPFSFGRFKLFAGRDSYSLSDAEISNYFEQLRMDMEGALYGSYFLELMDYYTLENSDETMMLGLLYQSLRALSKPSLSNRLVRYVFELKAMVYNGDFPGVPLDRNYSEALKYAVDFIVNSPLEKLYTFTLADEVLMELKGIMDNYRKSYIDRRLKSLEILDEML